MRGFLLILAAGTGRRAAELGGAGPAQCGRTACSAVRIAVVHRTARHPAHADSPVMGLDARPMTGARLCKCECAWECERRG